MDIVAQIFEQIFSLFISLFLFTIVSKKKLLYRDIFIAVILDLLIYFSIVILMLYWNVQIISYFLLPTVMILLSFVLMKPLNKTMVIFYGLFPVVLWHIFYRIILYFILPRIGIDFDFSNAVLLRISDLVAATVSVLFLNWLEYDFSQLRFDNLYQGNYKIIRFANVIMLSYFFLIQIFTYAQNEYDISTYSYRELLVIIQLVIFMGVSNKLDRRIKENFKEKLIFQQELQLKDMENYSNQIEGLYKEVRSFRHDYTNLLTTLKLGIESKDIDLIENIYYSVLKNSNKALKGHKYDVGRLSNIANPALKSLLAAKFSQASEVGIDVRIEVPEVIIPHGIDVIDLVTIVSILCDNAIEAAIVAQDPKMQIAYLSIGEKQIFIVENQIFDINVDIKNLYEYEESSKGEGRGIGLYNISKIISQYPNISIKTESYDYKFIQTLEINFKNDID